jgi:hypothetical protein
VLRQPVFLQLRSRVAAMQQRAFVNRLHLALLPLIRLLGS